MRDAEADRADQLVVERLLGQAPLLERCQCGVRRVAFAEARRHERLAAVVENRQGHRAEVGLLRQRAARAGANPVGLLDLVDVDVAPGARLVVDDLDPRLLALQFANRPMLPGELLVVGPGGRADDLAIDEQVDARLAFVVAAADEEIQEPALDGEFRRGQFSMRPVLAQVRIDEPLASKSADLLLRRQRAAPGPCRMPRLRRSTGRNPDPRNRR